MKKPFPGSFPNGITPQEAYVLNAGLASLTMTGQAQQCVDAMGFGFRVSTSNQEHDFRERALPGDIHFWKSPCVGHGRARLKRGAYRCLALAPAQRRDADDPSASGAVG